MISYNITIGDTLTKVFQRIPGGVLHKIFSTSHKDQITTKLKYISSALTTFEWVMYMLSCIVFAVGPGHILAERHFVILLSTLALTLPLSLYRNIEKLGKVNLLWSRQHSTVLYKLPVKHPRVLPGVFPVNGADAYHPHHCSHQSIYLRDPNVWMIILPFAYIVMFFSVFLDD